MGLAVKSCFDSSVLTRVKLGFAEPRLALTALLACGALDFGFLEDGSS
jgi:hypothetical protein